MDTLTNTQEAPVVPQPPSDINQVEGIDPLGTDAWHLKNTGQKSYASFNGLPGEDINSELSKDQLQMGEGIKVAVSDNGVEIYHPDLVSNSWFGQHRNYSYSNSDYWNTDPTPDGDEETDAHGTAVTGIIAATYNNSLGSRGVAAKAMFGGFMYVGVPYDLLKTLDQTNGPFDVFNYSYGRNSCIFQDLPDAIIAQLDYGVRNLRAGKGAVYVKAAGNEYVSSLSDCIEDEEGTYLGNANLEEDNSYPFLMVVGANTAYGTSASYSTPGSSLWISAPGGDYGINYPAIISTDLTGCSKGFSTTANGYNDFDQGGENNESCDYTSTMNGTSASAPMVSGTAAAILGVRNDLTWRDVKYIIALSARKLDVDRTHILAHPYSSKTLPGVVYEYGWQNNSAGFHFHNWYGFGALDLDKAIAVAQTFPSLGNQFVQTDWRNESMSFNTDIPDNSSTGFVSSINVVDNLVIEAVQIKVTVEHAHSSELGIILESPSGTKSTMLYYNSGILQSSLVEEIMLSNKFLGESSAGEWKLKVFDAATGNIGQFKNWKINFWGHYPDANESKRRPAYYEGVNTTSTSDTQTTLLEKGSLSHDVSTSETTAVKSLSGFAKTSDGSVVTLFGLIMRKIKEKHKDVDEHWNLHHLIFEKDLFVIFKQEKNFKVFNQEGELLDEYRSDFDQFETTIFENKIIRKINAQRLSNADEFIDFEKAITFFTTSEEGILALTKGQRDNLYELYESKELQRENPVSVQLPEHKYFLSMKKSEGVLLTLCLEDKTLKLTKNLNGKTIDNISIPTMIKKPLMVDLNQEHIQVVAVDAHERAHLFIYDHELKLKDSIELTEYFEREKFFFIDHKFYKVMESGKELSLELVK